MEWEVSLLALRSDDVVLYKVTLRVPHLGQSDTKIFTTKQQAEAQLSAWLRQVGYEAL